MIRDLWKELAKEKEQEEVLAGVQIDVSRILPPDRSYFTFPVSLTTPPCNEDGTWIVIKNATTISPIEVEQFSRLCQNDARPTERLYGRPVLGSKQLPNSKPNPA